MTAAELFEERRARLQPVTGWFEDGASTIGWQAMVTVPAVGDQLVLPGMNGPVLVVGRRWVERDVPAAARTMRDAGLDTLPDGRRWVAELTVR